MPRVHHVKSARKDNPVAKKGEPYYWWKFRYGGKQYSRTYPKRWRLTQSPFLQQLYQIEDGIDSEEMDREAAESLVAELESLMEDCQSSLDNMPYELQESSSSGQLLQERIDGLEEWIGEIEAIDFDHILPEEAADIIINANPGIS